MKNRLVLFTAFFGLIFTGFLIGTPTLCAAQTENIVNGFPTKPGVVVLDANQNIKALYPINGFPTDIEVLPSMIHFAVTTQAGEFLIFSKDGQKTFNAKFESLHDVDCADGEGKIFLLTSRSSKQVFFFNRDTKEQKQVDYPFKGPVDADLLDNGNLLVCDAVAGRVIEITDDGKLVWSYSDGLKQPMDALRLVDGNTLIADFDNHRLLTVSPSGEVISQLRGFDHPNKLSLLISGSVLVADSDQQEIEQINLKGGRRTIRKHLNSVQSVAFIPTDNMYLCAIQNKFHAPKQPIKPGAAVVHTQSEVKPSFIGGFLGNSYTLLITAIVLVFFSRRLKKQSLLSRAFLLVSYITIICITYAAHGRAVSSATHRPELIFWLGALVLCILVYKDAAACYWSKDKWIETDEALNFPFGFKDVLLLAAISLAALLAQYFHMKGMPLFGKIPWYAPMVIWGISLYLLYCILIQKRRIDSVGHSTFQFGPVSMAVPFSTGSVTLDEFDEQDGELHSSESSDRLADSWANTMLIIIIALGAALYFIGATSIPTDVHGDEAEVAMYSIQMRDSGSWNIFNPGWYCIPNLFYLIPGWVMWLCGDNLFGVRVAGGLIGVSCIPLFFILARRFLRPIPVVIATLLFAASSFFIHFSRMGIGYNQTTLFTLAVMYALVRGLQDKDSRWIALSGALSGLGVLSYQAAKILGPLVAASLLVMWITRSVSLRGAIKGLAAYLFAFCIVTAPLSGVYLTAPDATFSREQGITLLSKQGEDLIRQGYPRDISRSDLIKKQIEKSLLAPITYHDNSPYLANRTNGGMLDPVAAVLFTAGLFLILGAIRNPASRLLLLWIFCIPLVGSALTDNAPSYQRLVGLIPFLLIAAAPVLDGCLSQLSRAFQWPVRMRLHITTAILVVFVILGMNRYFHQIMTKPQIVDEWTRIARCLDDAGPEQYTFFFGPPYVYFKHGTLKFIAQDAKGEDVLKPEEFIKKRVSQRGPVCFLLVHNHRKYIHKLREMYPGGREENHFNSDGAAPFTTYEVNF
jgi:4-amino-4-deoxy-L-arabinose transferase-like glycosyltransferase